MIFGINGFGILFWFVWCDFGYIVRDFFLVFFEEVESVWICLVLGFSIFIDGFFCVFVVIELCWLDVLFVGILEVIFCYEGFL